METDRTKKKVDDLKNDHIAGLTAKIDYLEDQVEKLNRVSTFYENELKRILDHEDFENLMKECLHMLLLDPHKYDEDDE